MVKANEGKKTRVGGEKKQKVSERTKAEAKPHGKSGEGIVKNKDRIEGESKQAILIRLMKSPKGATIEELAEVTGWQSHSVRGVISGVMKKRLGLSITSEKAERGRIYRINGSTS